MTSAIFATRDAFSCAYGMDVTTIVWAPRGPSSTSHSARSLSVPWPLS